MHKNGLSTYSARVDHKLIYTSILSLVFGDSNIRKVYRPNQELLQLLGGDNVYDSISKITRSFETGSGTYGEKPLND